MNDRSWCLPPVRAAVVAGLCACTLPGQDAGAPVHRHWRSQVDALARPDARHDTLGPTGPRLWMTSLDARLGCTGQAHYVHHTPELRDPLTLELTGGDGKAWGLSPRARQWLPSHTVVDYEVDGAPAVQVRQERWITDDDVFVARFTVQGAPRLGVRWRSTLAPRAIDADARFKSVQLAGRANFDIRNAAELAIGGDRQFVFLEGEAAVYQKGSNGPDRKRAASGGAVLGTDFGGRRGDVANYELYSTGGAPWTLRLRYARSAATPANWTVSIGGSAVGTLSCAPTGGWGDAEAEFGLASLDLGSVPAGWISLQLEASHDDANTNIDGLFLLADEVADAGLPERASWSQVDAGRGRLQLRGGRTDIDGVPFAVLPMRQPQAVRLGDEALVVGGDGARLHVLAVPIGPAPRLMCGDASVPLRPRREVREPQAMMLPVAVAGPIELAGADCVLLAVTRERLAARDAEVRRGHATFHGVATEVRAGLHGLADPTSVDGQGGVVFHATLEFTGNRTPGAATARAVAPADTLASHRDQYAAWYSTNAPRLTVGASWLQRLWTYRWFLLRHNLAQPDAGNLPAGPVFYEGRHGSWYPRVITFSTPHIIAEARWLADPTLFAANVRALARLQQPDGEFPNLLVDQSSFRYTNWIPQATVDAFKVHRDDRALAGLLPALTRNVEGIAAAFDGDGDGLLAPGDHYTTGMEFQPSFWAHVGYDNRQPQTDLERPDFNAYHYGNARAVAAAARHLGDAGLAARLDALADRTRSAVLAKLWHDEDAFFYSVREGDDVAARCKEVIGFYPFRFGLPPDEPRYRRALASLIDPDEFWTPFPVASCSRKVPVYSAAVQRWPGPGGVVTPCMWNGPTWPHADSLVADSMASAVRHYAEGTITAAHLGELLRRFARFHCEDGQEDRPLLREYGDGETGVNWGCADYLHSTFNDLIICHVLGLMPRLDDVLEIRPLAVGLGDLRIEDIPYHGHRLAIAIEGEALRVWLDGEPLAVGSVQHGLSLTGFLR